MQKIIKTNADVTVLFDAKLCKIGCELFKKGDPWVTGGQWVRASCKKGVNVSTLPVTSF